jgi:V8-like Glu-specific endopeptidase
VRLAFAGHPDFADDADYALVGPLDNRVQEIRTRLFPLNTVCHLGRDFGFGLRWGCTGTLFAPQRLITAAHCLYSLKLGRAPRRIVVAPGRTDRDSFPYGRVASLAAFVPRRFVEARNRAERRANDYGLIMLQRSFPALTRFMALRVLRDSDLKQLQARQARLHVVGYPADRPTGTMWRHSEVLRRFTPQRLYYTVDTCPGHSGSPVWTGIGGQPVIVAVHTSGILDERGRSHGCAKGTVLAPPGSLNSGVRLRPEIIANLRNPQRLVAGSRPMIRVI